MSTAPIATASRGYAIAAIALASGLVVAIMFLPVILVADYVDVSIGERGTGAESAVGIAVIVRATFRRLFRAGMQSLFRTTIGAFTRTAARTLTRRAARLALRQVVMLTIASLFRNTGQENETERVPQNPLLALALGVAGLWLSFRVILALVPPDQAAVVLQGMPPWLAAALVALPLLVYAGASRLIGPLFGVQISFRTAPDGLLLQGYFTGAASFLPMTTDVEYAGSDIAKARTAGTTLIALLAIHLAINLVGRGLGSYPIQFAAAALLIYAFVFSFPLPPLEGHHLWRRHKLLWLAVWLLILAAFVANIPEAFTGIL